MSCVNSVVRMNEVTDCVSSCSLKGLWHIQAGCPLKQKTNCAVDALLGNKWCFTSFPLVSPFSIHSTVTLSLSSFKEVTIAWCIRPVKASETWLTHTENQKVSVVCGKSPNYRFVSVMKKRPRIKCDFSFSPTRNHTHTHAGTQHTRSNWISLIPFSLHISKVMWPNYQSLIRSVSNTATLNLPVYLLAGNTVRQKTWERSHVPETK